MLRSGDSLRIIGSSVNHCYTLGQIVEFIKVDLNKDSRAVYIVTDGVTKQEVSKDDIEIIHKRGKTLLFFFVIF